MVKELINLYKVGFVLLSLLSILIVVFIYKEWKSLRYIGSHGGANTITITGEGTVDAAPNVSVISVSIKEVSKDVKEAQDKVVKKAIELKKLAQQDFKIEDKDIKTTSFQSYPKYNYYNYTKTGKSILEGYEVVQTEEYKIRNTEDVGKFLEIVARLGITEFSGPNFQVDDINKYKEEARAKAIADAKIKAKKLAEQLDVDLVRIVYFSENDVYNPAPILYSREGFGGADVNIKNSVTPDISEGQQEIKSQVSITFEIR